MKRKLFLLLCTLLGLLLSVQGVKADVVKTDVTDVYITNPSFENDAADAVVTGWTAYGHSEEGLVDASSFPVTSAEDFVNKDGDKICKFYANRWTGWWSYWIIYQKATLPAGVYELDATIEADAGQTVSLFALPEADLNNKDNYINKTDVTGTDGNTGTKTSVTFTSNGSTPVVLGAGLVNVPSYYPFTFKVDNFKLYSLKNIDYTSLLANPNFESGDKTGWTDDSSTNDKFFVQNNDNFSKKQGTYYAERYWWDNTSDINQTTPELPAGIYRITAAAMDNAASPTFKLYAKAGSSDEVTQTVGAADDYSVEVSLKTAGTIKLGFKGTHTHTQWVAVDNFRLTYLGNPYPELNTAIETAEGYTLGFDAGEYAPYTNVDALTCLATAKSIYDAKTATYAEVVAATEALKGATWTANTELMDAVYDGGFLNTSVGDVHEGVTGWTTMGTSSGEESVFRQVVSAEKFESDKGLYIWPNTFKYGETDGYTMPLKANSYYRFTISYGGWSTGTNSPTVSILNTSGEGLAATQPGNAAQYTSGVRTYETVFRTGAAGNYVLSFISAENTNTVIGDIHLTYVGDAFANMAVNATAKWGTFCAPFAVAIPESVTAYTCENATKGVLNLKEVTTTIPANTPVILNAESGLVSTTFYGKKAANGSDDLIEGGLLRGNVSTSTKDVPNDGTAYLLQLHGDKVGFYKANGTGYLIGSNRCYLVSENLSGAREAFFFEDDATAISALEAVKAENDALKDGKYLIGGKIIVVKNGVKYSANGQKLN